MRKLAITVTSAALVAGLAPPAFGAGPGTRGGLDSPNVHIAFDPGTQPCEFDKTAPLSDEYASLGVHFQGPAQGEGGAVLNQCGRFGIRARSGEEFLAFNGTTYAKVPETVTFDSRVVRVAMFVANGTRGESTFKLVAKRDGEPVTRSVVVTKSAFYTQIAVRAHLGIDSVVLKATTPDQDTFVVDDLSFTPMQ